MKKQLVLTIVTTAVVATVSVYSTFATTREVDQKHESVMRLVSQLSKDTRMTRENVIRIMAEMDIDPVKEEE